MGAAVWVGVAHTTGYELTILAVVVGGSAGFGMGLGVKGRGGAPAGVLAAAAAVVCIVGAKLGVTHLMAQKLVDSKEMSVSPDDARAALVELVYVEFDSKGLEMTPPADDGYPREVWTEADRRWYAMSPGERENYRAGLEHQLRSGAEQTAGLLPRFGLFDLLCLGLAVGTAYRTASPKVAKGVGATPEDDAEQAPAMFRIAASEKASASVALAPAVPSPAAPPKAPIPAPSKKESAPTGLGIFSMLGKDPAEAPRSILAAEGSLDTPAKPLRITPPPQPGLIDLDFEDGQVAA